MDIQVNIHAPELVKAIESLALSMQGVSSPEPVKEEVKPEPKKEDKPEPKKEDKPEPKKEEAPKQSSISLEEVRAVLSDLSKAGKQADVKQLISDTGAQKLSDVPADQYIELMEKAKGLK